MNQLNLPDLKTDQQCCKIMLVEVVLPCLIDQATLAFENISLRSDLRNGVILALKSNGLDQLRS